MSNLVFSYIGITISPNYDLVVSLNTSGVFVCEAESPSTDFNWLMQFPGSLPLPIEYYTPDELDLRGVTLATMNTISTLRISGLPENNNTVLYCHAHEGDLTSQVVSFRVLGKYRDQFSEHLENGPLHIRILCYCCTCIATSILLRCLKFKI